MSTGMSRLATPDGEGNLSNTHVTVPEWYAGSGMISTPFSSRALRMSIVATILAMASHTPLSARRCPGQVLQSTDMSLGNGETVVYVYLLPNPKTSFLGSLMSKLLSGSMSRNLSGRKTSGSG